MTRDEVLSKAASAGITAELLANPSRVEPLCWARVAVAWQLKLAGMRAYQIGQLYNRSYRAVSIMWQQWQRWESQPEAFRKQLSLAQKVVSGEPIGVALRTTMREEGLKQRVIVERQKRTCRDCVKYPCFRGIENLETNFALTCRGFKKIESVENKA